MSSGCYLALHVNVSMAGCYNPGPEIKHKGGVRVCGVILCGRY